LSSAGRGAIESETKLRLADAEAGRAALQRWGARLVTARHFEDNQIYDDAHATLSARKCLVRLRRTPTNAVLTFKGPGRIENGIKSREELETTVGDADTLVLILERLGLGPRFRYQKYREVYAHGALVVVLDETPVGAFLELEGLPDEIHAAAAALGYRRDEYIGDSYGALFLRSGGTGDMVFK
jgi:adenylate cyclase, class 2